MEVSREGELRHELAGVNQQIKLIEYMRGLGKATEHQLGQLPALRARQKELMEEIEALLKRL